MLLDTFASKSSSRNAIANRNTTTKAEQWLYEVIGRLGVSSHAAVAASAAYVRKIRFQFELENDDD